MRKDKIAHLAVWRTWDWSLQDWQLAEVHGVTRERVRQIRVEFGFPRAARHRRHRNSCQVRFLAVFGDERAPLPTATVALVLGVSRGNAAALMLRNGMPRVSESRKRDWAAVDWSLPPKRIAEELGCHRVTVYKRRKEEMKKQLTVHGAGVVT